MSSYLTDEIRTVLNEQFKNGTNAYSRTKVLRVANSLVKEAMASKSDWMEVNTVAMAYRQLSPLEDIEAVLKAFEEKGFIVCSKFRIAKAEAKKHGIPTHVRYPSVSIATTALNFNPPNTDAFLRRKAKLEEDIQAGRDVPDGLEGIPRMGKETPVPLSAASNVINFCAARRKKEE